MSEELRKNLEALAEAARRAGVNSKDIIAR